MEFNYNKGNKARASYKNIPYYNAKFKAKNYYLNYELKEWDQAEANNNPIFYRSKVSKKNHAYSKSISNLNSIKDEQSGQKKNRSPDVINQYEKLNLTNQIEQSEERFESYQQITHTNQNSTEICAEFELEIDEDKLLKLLIGDKPDSSYDFLKHCYENKYLTSNCDIEKILNLKKTDQNFEESEVNIPSKCIRDNTEICQWKDKKNFTKIKYDRDAARLKRFSKAYNVMMAHLSKISPYEAYTKGLFFLTEFAISSKKVFDFYKVHPHVHQTLKFMSTKTKIEYLITYERAVREYYQDVCKEFLDTGAVSFEKKAKLWNVYWFTYSLRDLLVFALTVPLHRIKGDFLAQTKSIKPSFKVENIDNMGYCALKETDTFNIEGYLKYIVKWELDFEINECNKLFIKPDARLCKLLDPKMHKGIILETYYKNGRIRDIKTGEEFEFSHNDTKLDYVDIIAIEKMMINKHIPTVLFTPYNDGVVKKAINIVYLGNK